MDATMIEELNDWYKGQNVFVTGHTGFKGAWLSAWLTQAGARVTGYALAPNTGRQNLFAESGLDSSMTSVIADICDRQTLDTALSASNPSIVFHLAAQSLVRPSYADPVETYRTNVLGTVQLLDAIRALPSVRAVVIVTSDKCYENLETGRSHSEDDRLGGNDPYSSSKGCAELATAAFRHSFFRSGSTAVASARAGNVIGGGDWSEDRIVPDIMLAAQNRSAAIIRNPAAVRPWQFVLEPLRGYVMLGRSLATRGQQFASAWNFGPRLEDSVSVGQLAERIMIAWGDVTIRHEPQVDAPPESSVLRINSAKAEERLGWTPVISLDRAVDMTVASYREFQNGSVSHSMKETLRSYWNEVDAAHV